MKVLEAEKRLQAMDFWVRNPDYLAHEYLERFDEGCQTEDQLLEVAREIMAGDEPELRRLGMLRFMFGAFEAVDDAVSKLASLGMVEMRRKYNRSATKVMRTDYLLMEIGLAEARTMAEHPPLDWYARRAEQAAFIAGNSSGEQLKRQQKLVDEYRDQTWNNVIPPIAARVRARLSEYGRA